ncbi:hypothetical protein ACQP3L_34730, partial [Escherichia coli]
MSKKAMHPLSAKAGQTEAPGEIHALTSRLYQKLVGTGEGETILIDQVLIQCLLGIQSSEMGTNAMP